MGIDSDAQRQLIDFARSQMARRGEIDTLIFTTENILDGLKKASENLDTAVADVDQAFESMEERAHNDQAS